MATILPFPAKKTVPDSELTGDECRAVHNEAFALMQQGCSTGVSHQADGMYMYVFDQDGEPYFIGRESGVCYLFGPTGTFIARNTRFEVVLDALTETLS